MEKHIITYYENTNPTTDCTIATGYALGQRWFNSITGIEYLHVIDGFWSESVIPNYDFIFVDVWRDEIINGGFEPYASNLYAIELNSNDDPINITHAIRLCKSVVDANYGSGFNFVTIQGIGVDIPISQTTIFIHPTTFERYMFNGTIMVVYNDIYEIVPKYLEYNALFTPTADILLPKVLNQSDSNYIGDVTWTYNISEYVGTNSKIKDGFTLLKKITNGNTHDDDFILGFYSGPSEVVINNDGLLFEGNDYSIQFKQRIPGAPPKLILAETNTIGDKVILTFDKHMNDYQPNIPYFILNGAINSPMYNSVLVDNNRLNLSLDLPILNIDIVTIDFIGDITTSVESLDFGLLQQFSNIPVTNNVPIPPPLEITEAYTNITGDEVTLVFSTIMSNINIGNMISTHSINIYINDILDNNNIYAQNMLVLDNRIIFSNFIYGGGFIPTSADTYFMTSYAGTNNTQFTATNGSQIGDFNDLFIQNCIILPQMFISGRTNQTATEVILDFDRDMTNNDFIPIGISHSVLIIVNDFEFSIYFLTITLGTNISTIICSNTEKHPINGAVRDLIPSDILNFHMTPSISHSQLMAVDGTLNRDITEIIQNNIV